MKDIKITDDTPIEIVWLITLSYAQYPIGMSTYFDIMRKYPEYFEKEELEILKKYDKRFEK